MDYETLAREFLGKAVEFCRFPEKRELGSFATGEVVALSFLNVRGETRPSELCRVLGVTTARTANLLKSLEAKGLVERAPDSEDGRRVIVRITADGKVRAERAFGEVLGAVRKQLELLGEEDARAFVRIFGRVIENIRNCPLDFAKKGAGLC